MKVQITVRGRSYTVRSDEEGEDLQEVARYVDSKMSEIADKSPRLDDYTVALLAAMNIASELARVRRDIDAELAGVEHDLASAAVVLDGAARGRAE